MSELKRRFDPDVRAVRLELRKLLEAYPEAFPLVMAHLIRCGEGWREVLPPIEKGRDGSVRKVTEGALLQLYAGYLSRPEGMTRKQFLDSVSMSFGSDYAVGTWRGETLKYYLRKAEALAKRDPAFRLAADARRRKAGGKAPSY